MRSSAVGAVELTRRQALSHPRSQISLGRACSLAQAYKADESTMTPYPGSSLPPAESNFNHLQSSMRMPVECAFGRLVGMWGVHEVEPIRRAAACSTAAARSRAA